MMTPKVKLEAKADHKGVIDIPDVMREAWFCYRHNWTPAQYRAAPAYIIKQMEFIEHLEQLAERAAERGK